MFILEHRAHPAPSGFWPPHSCCTTSKFHTVRTPSCFQLFLWVVNCHSHFMTTIPHAYKQCYPLVTTIPHIQTALWWSHFGHHCNSGWLCQQAESNPEPLAHQACTWPLHQRGDLTGKASIYCNMGGLCMDSPLGPPAWERPGNRAAPPPGPAL